MSRSEVLRASPRMFDSDLLDKLSRVHPAVPPILFGPVIAFLAGVRRCQGQRLGDSAVDSRRLPVLDADRVLAAPDRVPLRARAGHRCTVALDHSRRPPRPPQRSDAAGDAAIGERAAVGAVRVGLLRRVRQPRVHALRAPGSWVAICSTTCCTTTCTTTGRRPASASGCASCTCAITSRTTSAATASALRSGITSSVPRRRTAPTRTAERAGFEPAMEREPHTRLAGECLQPLGHLSVACRQCRGASWPGGDPGTTATIVLTQAPEGWQSGRMRWS